MVIGFVMETVSDIPRNQGKRTTESSQSKEKSRRQTVKARVFTVWRFREFFTRWTW